MKISLIAAVDKKLGIGQGNAMSWHLPRDFQHFRETTMGKVILMGRNTAVSMGRALPGRENWVLTSKSAPFPQQKSFRSINQALTLAESLELPEICVIGGGQVYLKMIDLASDLYITHVQATLPADTYFPRINPKDWKGENMFSQPIDKKHLYAFDVVHYTRS